MILKVPSNPNHSMILWLDISDKLLQQLSIWKAGY